MSASSTRFTSRSSGVVLEDLIAVPIDVGKHTAAASVSDFTGRELALEECLRERGEGRKSGWAAREAVSRRASRPAPPCARPTDP